MAIKTLWETNPVLHVHTDNGAGIRLRLTGDHAECCMMLSMAIRLSPDFKKLILAAIECEKANAPEFEDFMRHLPPHIDRSKHKLN